MQLVYGSPASAAQLDSILFDPSPLNQPIANISVVKTSVQHHEVHSTTNTANHDSGNGDKMETAWECGTDQLTKLVSESKIKRHCPRLRSPINQCCINHDYCYDKQFGKELCDDTFCNCLNTATINNPVCNKRDARSFCELVRAFGETAYMQAGRPLSD
uniref:Uncharacterized protein n=1 Tax=Setaria digitata TaxID=48799 RepID=A0A915PML0_9BILA